MTAITLVSGSVSLFFLFFKPINNHAMALKENTLNTKANTAAVERLEKKVDEELKEIRKNQKESIDELKKEKQESHKRIWEHEAEQDEAIRNNTISIKIIQERVGINGEQRD